MKKTFAIALIIFLALNFNACDKSDSNYMGAGVVTGYDVRDCACCGGLLINLNSSSTELYSDSTYQIDLVPGNFDIDANTVFPVFINLDYSRNTKKCGKTIDILKFERK
jgi:hypothetical protein